MALIYYYALKEDLLPVIAAAESKGDLVYTRTGNFSRDEVQNGIAAFMTGADLPNLGKATGRQWSSCNAYLVCNPTTPVTLRVLRSDNGERICIDQLVNPDSIVFRSGGAWSEEVVIHGGIGTASNTPVSKALMRRFSTPIKKQFTKIGPYFVGPAAMKLLRSGVRFTGAIQSPKEYDLAYDPAGDDHASN